MHSSAAGVSIVHPQLARAADESIRHYEGYSNAAFCQFFWGGIALLIFLARITCTRGIDALY